MDQLTQYLPYILNGVGGAVLAPVIAALLGGKGLGGIGNILAGVVGGIGVGAGAQALGQGAMLGEAALVGPVTMGHVQDLLEGGIGGGVLGVVLGLVKGKSAS